MDHFFFWQLRRISATAARLTVEEALLWRVAVESEGHIGEAMQIDRCSWTVFSLQTASTSFGEAVDGQGLLPRIVRGRRIKHASAVRGVVVGERVADARPRAPLRAVGVLQAVARLQKPFGRPAPALPNEGVRLGPEVRASSVPMRQRSEVVDSLHRKAVGVVGRSCCRDTLRGWRRECPRRQTPSPRNGTRGSRWRALAMVSSRDEEESVSLRRCSAPSRRRWRWACVRGTGLDRGRVGHGNAARGDKHSLPR